MCDGKDGLQTCAHISIQTLSCKIESKDNRRTFQILRFMADLLVRVRVMAYVSDAIGRRFEKVRNDHRIGRRFDKLAK
jgi:hypothetical protein